MKPEWLIFSDKYKLGGTLDNPYFYSHSWCMGGSYGNCWNNIVSTVEAEEPPLYFKKFDDLILSISEDISLSVYREIYNSCVSTGITNEVLNIK